MFVKIDKESLIFLDLLRFYTFVLVKILGILLTAS